MANGFIEMLNQIKSERRWSWDRLAKEINQIQGGRQGVTGPTLFRYSKGSTQPRNEMMKEFIIAGIRKLQSPSESTSPSNEQTEYAVGPQELFQNQIDTFYQSLYQNTPIMMHAIGRDGRLICVNQHWLKAMGHIWQDVIGRRSIEFLTPRSRKKVEADFMPELLAEEFIENAKLEFIKKDGGILDVLLSACGVFDNVGKLEYLVAAMVEATAISAPVKELELFKALLENAPDHVLTLDVDGRIRYLNKLLDGFTLESVVGKPIFDFVDRDYAQTWRDAVDHVVQTGESQIVESLAYGAHHVPTWFEAHIGPLELNGERKGVSIISSDVSERKKTEKRFRTLFENNIAGVFRTTVDGNVLDCNEAFANMLGFSSKNDVLKSNSSEFYQNEADRKAYLDELLTKGYVKNYEIRHRRADGRTVWVLANSSLLEDEMGERTIILGTLLDITEKKELEEQILKQNEYLQVLHDTAMGIISHTDLDVLLEAIMLRAGSLVGTTHGFIYLTDPGSMKMNVKFATGELRKFIGAETEMGEGLAGRVWQSGRPIAVEDYRHWPERLEVSEYDILHSIVGMPLKSGREVVGVLGLAYLDPDREFGDEEISILSQFAELASIALDNVRLYEQFERQLSQREGDLRRIQNDLSRVIAEFTTPHENINGSLEQSIPDKLGEIVESIQSTLRES